MKKQFENVDEFITRQAKRYGVMEGEIIAALLTDQCARLAVEDVAWGYTDAPFEVTWGGGRLYRGRALFGRRLKRWADRLAGGGR